MRTIQVDMTGASSSSSLGGYTCSICKAWVSYGNAHHCAGVIPSPPQPAYTDHGYRYAAALERIAAALEAIAKTLLEEKP